MTAPAGFPTDLDGGRWLTSAEARQLLLAEVDQLRACEVRVCWPGAGWRDGEQARLTQFLDDGVYYVELNPAAPFVEQVALLEQVWSAWLEPNDPAWWVVESAKPDDVDSLPARYTSFFVDDGRRG